MLIRSKAVLLSFALSALHGLAYAQSRVTAVDEELSTMTETPAGDTILEGSHVVVGSPGGQRSTFSMLGMLGGGIGALIGSAIDNANAQASAKETTASVMDALKLKWFRELNDELTKLAEAEPDKYKLQIGTPEDPGIKLRAYARIAQVSKEDKNFNASLGVITRLKDESGSEMRRTYNYPLGIRPLVGERSWTKEGTSLKEASNAALVKVAKVIANELSGLYKEKFARTDLPTLVLKPPAAEKPMTYYVLDQIEGTYVVLVDARGKPGKFYVGFFDQAVVDAWKVGG